MTSKEVIEEMKKIVSICGSVKMKKDGKWVTIAQLKKEDVEQIEKDLDVLDILKKQITVTENKTICDSGNYITSYDLNITIDGLDFIQFDKIKEWLKK